MAVSGNQKTRIGASLSGVGRKLTISAKVENLIIKYNEGKRVLLIRYGGKYYTGDTP